MDCKLWGNLSGPQEPVCISCNGSLHPVSSQILSMSLKWSLLIHRGWAGHCHQWVSILTLEINMELLSWHHPHTMPANHWTPPSREKRRLSSPTHTQHPCFQDRYVHEPMDKHVHGQGGQTTDSHRLDQMFTWLWKLSFKVNAFS